MNKKMYADTALPDQERMLQYKFFAAAFSYPDDKFFEFFPQMQADKKELISLYDNFFRANEIWLYASEHLAENEFQRANALSDIMGFYRAFKVEPDKERADSLAAELEFMHYLIFKRIHALKNNLADAAQKAEVCLDAQKKFFKAHLYPGAEKIANKIAGLSQKNFYGEIAVQLLDFLKAEKRYLGEP